MRGSPKSRRLDAPIAVSLEDVVPPDHVYRLSRSVAGRCQTNLASAVAKRDGDQMGTDVGVTIVVGHVAGT